MLPPVVLMHRLTSSHLESSWLQRKLPSKDSGEIFQKSWFYGCSSLSLWPLQGPPRGPWGPGEGGQLDGWAKPRGDSSQAGASALGLGFGWISAWISAWISVWIWLAFDSGWIWVDFASISIRF